MNVNKGYINCPLCRKGFSFTERTPDPETGLKSVTCPFCRHVIVFSAVTQEQTIDFEAATTAAVDAPDVMKVLDNILNPKIDAEKSETKPSANEDK